MVIAVPSPTDSPEFARSASIAAASIIAKVTRDVEERIQLNTAVAAMMELKNEILRVETEVAGGAGRPALREALETLVLLLNPFTPHVCEELWRRLGHETGLVRARWPQADAAVAREDEVELAVQVNGKVRGRVTVARGSAEAEVREKALAEPRVAEQLQGHRIVRCVVVPDRLVSVVVE